jgi:hypothetical protein
MKRSFLCGILLMMLFPSSVFAEGNTEVKVSFPIYKVSINGVLVNNVNNQYPFIVYNDITYVPMTWMDSRFLGLETTWDKSNGLTVNKTNQFNKYQPYDLALNDLSKIDNAEIVNHTIRVNNIEILNKNETYPLLAFRNITYFPLTWRFAVDEFGWSYSWSQKEGLKIDTLNTNAEENEKYNVLSILNTTAFSKGYDIETKGILKNGEENFKLDAKVKNQFAGNVFISDVKSIEPFPFMANLITHWSWNYYSISDQFNNNPGAFAEGSVSNGRVIYPAFFESPVPSINKFQVIGEMKDRINEFKRTSENQYQITFKEDSKWANRKMKIKIDPINQVLAELTIEDKNANGTYNIDTKFNNVIN